jgi:hypothetical protein
MQNEHERLVHGPSTYIQEERPFCDNTVFVQACFESPVELARMRRGNSAKRVAKSPYVSEVKVPDEGQRGRPG